MTRNIWCECADEMVPSSCCDGCAYDDIDCAYEAEPPLYPDGFLAAMSLEQLEKEFSRQCHYQGALGDAEHIDNYAVEATEARCRLVQSEIAKRKATT